MDTVINVLDNLDVQQILDISGVMFVALNTKGEVSLINKKGCEILGYSENEMIGKNWFDNFLPDDISQKVKSVFYSSLRRDNGIVGCYKNYVLTKKHEKRMMHFNNSVLRNRRGNIIGTLSSGLDITEEELSRNGLIREKVKAKATINSIGDGLVSADLLGRIIEINSVAEKIIGWKFNECKELSLKDILNIIDEDTGEMQICPFEKVVNLEETCVFEDTMAIVSKEGKTISIDGKVTPILGKDGKIFGVVFVFRDVTEERFIKKHLQLLEFTLKISNLHFFLISPDGNFLMVNDSACKSLSYSQKELLDLKVFDVDPEFNKERWYKHWENLVEKKVMTFESVHKRKDGSTFPVRITTNYFKFSNNEYNFAFSEDITQHKKREEDLFKFNEMLKVIIETAPLPIISLNKTGIVQMVWNPAAEKMLGWKKEEVIGKKIPIMESGDIIEIFSICRKGGNFNVGNEIRISDKSGEIIDCFIYASPIRDTGLNVTGCIIVIVDISNRKKMERELINKNKELTQFAYMVSHDLKSPLSIISGYLELIREDPSVLGEFLSKVIDKSRESLLYIDKVLNLARAGRYINEIEDLDIEEIITRVYWAIKPKNVDSNLKIDSPLLKIKGDPAGIENLITNILSNAFEYRDLDKESLDIEVSSIRDNKNIVFKIKDNGIGIKNEYFDKIFYPGYTIDPKKGTGFGLIISKKIVESHKGKIWVESKGEKMGTKICFTIPV